ncbi:hypothetical protein L7F22_035722 [Adiantum nelumboides]|nr:hypothetical protein [Adiantum nelumboides]
MYALARRQVEEELKDFLSEMKASMALQMRTMEEEDRVQQERHGRQAHVDEPSSDHCARCVLYKLCRDLEMEDLV